MDVGKMKLHIGSGFVRKEGFINIDIVQCIDDNGIAFTDIVMDIEKESLPFEDNSIEEIAAYEILEHIGFSKDNPNGQEALIFVMNEMWRVLKPTGFLHGKVPGTHEGSISDPTHKRVFLDTTFDYFCGINKHNAMRPTRPRNADYGIMPWYKISVDKRIRFTLRPRKTKEYNLEMETL
jgi:hypothetical protein